jgi:hypothetical protein
MVFKRCDILEAMWNTILGVNSFIVWPLTVVFLVYSAGRVLLFFDWKLFIVAVIVFLISTAAGLALSILSD